MVWQPKLNVRCCSLPLVFACFRINTFSFVSVIQHNYTVTFLLNVQVQQVCIGTEIFILHLLGILIIIIDHLMPSRL